MLVRENILFKRGIPPKHSLEIGRGRFRPTMFTGHSYWADNEAKVNAYKKNHSTYGELDVYPVYLIPKKFTPEEVMDLFASSADNPETKLNQVEKIDEILIEVDEDSMGEWSFTVLETYSKAWEEWDLENLRVVSTWGEDIGHNIHINLSR